MDKLYEGIIQPYTYISTNGGGKGYRNKLIDEFNLCFQISDAKISKIKEFINILHNSSLLIDDIEDGSDVRRGSECAHLVFGIASTINAGNLMYFKAWQKLQEIAESCECKYDCRSEDILLGKLSRLFVDSMVKLHLGQGKEIYWRDYKICPTENEYIEMVKGKTAELFKLGVNLMECVSEMDDILVDKNEVEKLKTRAETLGIQYQIQNDIDDLEQDLKEGKYSYPVVCAIQFCGAPNFYKDSDPLDIAKTLHQIKACGGFDMAKNRTAAK